MYEIIVNDVLSTYNHCINFSQHTFMRRNRKYRAIEGQQSTENQRLISSQYLLPVLIIRSVYGAWSHPTLCKAPLRSETMVVM